MPQNETIGLDLLYLYFNRKNPMMLLSPINIKFSALCCYFDRKSCTQDNSADVIKQSREILMNYMRQIMNSIIDSYSRCPPVMRLVFRNLRKRVSEKWQKEEDEVLKQHLGSLSFGKFMLHKLQSLIYFSYG